MDEELGAIVRAFSDVAFSIERRVSDEVSFWAPDPPLANPILGSIGQEIGENFDSFDEHQKQKIFWLMEKYMRLDDDELSTAVATGLIEALVHKAEEVKGRLNRILSYMGPESKKYADGWINFTNGLE